MSGPASIAGVIAAEGGEVTFGRFMESALTHPTLGYYSRADRLLRHGGDFNTAPALSPFFNRTVARLVTQLLDASLTEQGPGAAGAAPSSVVELGGGEGHLAAAILGLWADEFPALRGRLGFRILEVGAGLRQRQAEAVAEAVVSGWDVGWGATLEEACAGTRPVVMVGNEFVDTLPAHLLRVAGGETAELYVRSTAAGGLEQVWGTVSEVAAAEAELLFGTRAPAHLETLTSDGIIEVFPGLVTLMQQAAAVMPVGSLVNIDYGEWFPGVVRDLPDGERWGSADRVPRHRTVRGYFKHRPESDPSARPGRQDVTADVDFAALDLHGRHAGFETILFTTLAAFLGVGGAEAELQALGAAGSASDPLEADRQATVLRNLVDPGDLGGAFKLMVQVRG